LGGGLTWAKAFTPGHMTHTSKPKELLYSRLLSISGRISSQPAVSGVTDGGRGARRPP